MSDLLKDVLTISEAAELYGFDPSWLRRVCMSGKFGGEARKSGATWLITRAGMKNLYGEPREKSAEIDC